MLSSKQLRQKAKAEARKILEQISNISCGIIEEEIVHHTEEEEEIVQNFEGEEIVQNFEEEEIVNTFFEDSEEEGEGVNGKSEATLSEGICKWAIKFNITNALNGLLELLNSENINVPKDARTIKKTPTVVVQNKLAGGIYVHYGLKTALTDFLHVNDFLLDDLLLDFNIDGLPLYKSSNKQVWPILGSIANTTTVFLVGVFAGISKPNSAEVFLEEFVVELNQLTASGISFNNKTINIKVRCFVMDAPANSFVLGTKGHSGYNSCVRCCQTQH